jgi:hypothetical protein
MFIFIFLYGLRELIYFSKIALFWDVAPCSVVEIDRRFRDAYCLYHHRHVDPSTIKAMMMEAESTSETSVSFYQTTRLNIPEDSHLHASHRENLKST